MLKSQAKPAPDSSKFRGGFLRRVADMPQQYFHPFRKGCKITGIEHGNNTKSAMKPHTETAWGSGRKENRCLRQSFSFLLTH